MSNIRYISAAEAWDKHNDLLRSLILSRRAKRVLDVGGGANPTLDLEFVKTQEIDCTVLDVSQRELEKAGSGYKTFVGDITDPRVPDVLGGFDLIYSKMAAEHARHGRAFHENIFRMLKPGGLAFHFFPTLYCFPLVLNRLFPERLTWQLRKWVQPHTTEDGKADKFPAYYSWCRGPSRRQIRRLEQLGFAVEEYIGHFGHTYYEKIPILGRLERATTSWFLAHPNPYATSSAFVLLQRPSA